MMTPTAKKIFKEINRTNSAYKMLRDALKLLVIVVLTSLPFSDAIGQFEDRYHSGSSSINSQVDYSSPDRIMNKYEDTFFKTNSDLEEIHKLKSEPGYSLFLDSIYEVNNIGYKTEYNRWYYGYNDLYQVDSVLRYFYDENGDILNIVETRTYNSAGQLKRFLRRQPVFNDRSWEPDTSVIDYQIEEYTYEDGNLVRKLNIRNEFSFEFIIIDFYVYDELGKLVYDSTYYNPEQQYARAYLYNENGELEYSYTVHETYDYSVLKTTYEEIDDTLNLITESNRFFDFPIDTSQLDTITQWRSQRFFYETHDENNRRTSLLYKWEIEGREYYEFKAEYKYTPWGDLLHATYYHWIGTTAEGEWQEATHIDNTYDEEGNILLHENTFWDARVEVWELCNRKEYYYTSISNALAIEDKELQEFSIYPNPAEDILNVQLANIPGSVYSISNICGGVVANGSLENGTISISSLKSGIYILSVHAETSSYSAKFIKH